MTDESLFNFEPEMNHGGFITKKIIKLTLGKYRLRESFEVEVINNSTGIDAIKSALYHIYKFLPFTESENYEGGGYATIYIGGVGFNDEEGLQTAWLDDFLISAEIIRFEPAGTVSDLIAGRVKN